VKRRKNAFTIVELLTSIVIIAILISLLIPSIAMVRRTAKETAQKAQFTSIDMGLTAFKNDYGDYPPSNWPDFAPPLPPWTNYCGAQKLAEAMFGWDLMGFHPQSAWRADGLDAANGNLTYDPGNARLGASLNERKGRYLELATANVFRVGNVGGVPGLFNNPGFLDARTFVICDVFTVRRMTDSSGKTVRAGTPILYYKANTASKTITAPPPNNWADRIYDYRHNRPLIELLSVTPSGGPGKPHPLATFQGGEYVVFYGSQYGIKDPKIMLPQPPWPHRPDSYILISAGMDGLYGTADDIRNF
jgi:prepilin-type N-terminal cleavage/methylation domain-containing protein